MPQAFTPRSIAHLEAQGYAVARTEHWMEFKGSKLKGGVRKDLFGFADLAAIRRNVTGVLAVQVCRLSDVAHRRAKILSTNAAHLWLSARNRIEIHGWYQTRDFGTRRRVWRVKVVPVARQVNTGGSST